MELGYQKGEVCNRNGCEGIIDALEKEGSCSCHINPPCSYCTDSTEYCPTCDWSGADEQNEYFEKRKSIDFIPFKVKTLSDLDNTKIDWISESHTHFSMLKKGVYPPSATQEDVLRAVRGTFGGRFTQFGGGQFQYIAYTD